MIHKKTTEELVAERQGSADVKKPRTPIIVVADNIRSLDNVGLLFRLCELARVGKLYLTGYTGYPRKVGDTRPENIIERHDNRIAKTAVYALDHQPWEYIEDPVPLIEQLKKQGHQIVALEQTDKSVNYYDAAFKQPVVLIVGHEREGVRQELLDLADVLIEIPILGIGNSHNLATATGIVLYKMLEPTTKTQ